MSIKLTVKIISSKENKIIGWAGDALLVEFNSSSENDLAKFIAMDINISTKNISFLDKKGNIYRFLLNVKNDENLEVLFT